MNLKQVSGNTLFILIIVIGTFIFLGLFLYYQFFFLPPVAPVNPEIKLLQQN